MRSILKDVVPTDPQKLLEQIEAIKNLIDSEEQLREVTRIIFEKVILSFPLHKPLEWIINYLLDF